MVRGSADRRFYLTVWYGGTCEERRATSRNTYTKTKGMIVTLANGTKFEDWTGQAFVNNIGMGRADVAEALAKQSRRMSWLTPGEFAEIRLALTRDLLSILPRGLSIPFYGVGGSDSIEAAIRAARKTTGRKKVLTFTQAYHGDTISVENVSGFPLTTYGDPRPWAVHTPSPYDLWQETGGWTQAYELALEGAKKTLRRQGARTFACMIVEPVMGVGGAVPLSHELAKGLRELCDHYDIKLVADEVITGFGRTGEWFGSQTVGLKPDAMIFAKGLTGGYAPLGAVVFEKSWGEELRRTGFPHGLTFGAHPLGCAAARATIRILREGEFVGRAKRIGKYLRSRLERMSKEHADAVRDVRGEGLLQAIELRSRRRRRNGATHPAWPRVKRVWEGLRREGIRVTTNNDGSSLLLCPPFVVTEGQVDRLTEALSLQVRRA